jgi:hypothetical protein
MGHGKQIGSIEFVESADMDSMSGDTMITFANKKSIDGLIESLTLLSETVEDESDGDYRLIKLDSMPENWSHLRMYQNGGTIVVNKDFTEREATESEVLGIMIFVVSGRYSYVDEPVKSEYPKYVLNNRGEWDIAYIEQAGPSEWSCVGKDHTRAEMMPGLSPKSKARLFNQFIGDGSWRYVTKAEAVSRLESQS